LVIYQTQLSTTISRVKMANVSDADATKLAREQLTMFHGYVSGFTYAFSFTCRVVYSPRSTPQVATIPPSYLKQLKRHIAVHPNDCEVSSLLYSPLSCSSLPSSLFTVFHSDSTKDRMYVFAFLAGRCLLVLNTTSYSVGTILCRDCGNIQIKLERNVESADGGLSVGFGDLTAYQVSSIRSICYYPH
jgi:hypothetical protein